MGCKLTNNIDSNTCEYQIAGVLAVWLINYDSDISYTFKDGVITEIKLPTGSFAYKLDSLDNSASWTDDLAVNGNGGKYRTHTLNLTIGNYDKQIIEQSQALDLGRFVAVVKDKSGRTVVLGRNNGLTASSFNYASGASDADANGWTTSFTGTEKEVGQLLQSDSLIKSLVAHPVTTDNIAIVD